MNDPPEDPENPAIDEARAGLACPFCGSSDWELVSPFSSTLMTSQYYCRNCRSHFEAVRWGAPPAGPNGKCES